MDFGHVAFDLGSIGLVSFLALKYLLPRWVENQFQEQLEKFKRLQAEELEKYRFEIQKMFNRALKVHEKEFSILPELWDKLQWAHGAISTMWGERIDHFYDLNISMSPADFEAYLNSYGLSENEKTKIREATDKNKKFNDILAGHRHFDADKAYREMNNFYILNQLFIDSRVQDSFDPIKDILASKLAVFETNKMAPGGNPYDHYNEKWTQIKPMMEGLKKMIQARLRFEEA